MLSLFSSVGKASLLALAAATASAILFLSVPRTASAFLTISGDKVLSLIRTGRDVTSEQLDQLENSRKEALKWICNGRAYHDLSVVQSIRRGILNADLYPLVDNQSLSFARSSLIQSPANGRVWLRLAGAEFHLHGDTKLLSDALTTSLLTAPVLPLRTLYRIELALASSGFEQSADRNLIFRQMRIAWKVSTAKTVAFSAMSARRTALFRAALASDPSAYERFNLMLNQYFDGRQTKPSAS